MSQSCFYHIRALHHTRSELDLPTTTAIASALISSRLDCANSDFYGSPSKNIARLQRTQNVAARVATQNHLTFSAMFTATPPYLCHLLIPYCSSRVLRSSSSSSLLQVPRNNLIFRFHSTHSVHPVHSTLSGGTSKHPLGAYQATFNTPSRIIQRFRFTYMINCAL